MADMMPLLGPGCHTPLSLGGMVVDMDEVDAMSEVTELSEGSPDWHG